MLQTYTCIQNSNPCLITRRENLNREGSLDCFGVSFLPEKIVTVTRWAAIMRFSACSLVSKWLLYRQRRAVCCEMLLRHNWVGEARAFRSGSFLLDVFSLGDSRPFVYSNPPRCVTSFSPDTYYVFHGHRAHWKFDETLLKKMANCAGR